MANPVATPELGVTQYSTDRTQGPACALACAAGTVFRNYFVLVDDKGRLRSQQSDSGEEGGVVLGQRAGQQLNTLRDLEELLDNDTYHYFSIENGYTNGSEYSVGRLKERLQTLDESGVDALRAAVRVGLHADVGITFEVWVCCEKKNFQILKNVLSPSRLFCLWRSRWKVPEKLLEGLKKL
jgi:hypothetical protein